MKKTFTILSFVFLGVSSACFAYCAFCFNATLQLMQSHDINGIGAVFTVLLFALFSILSAASGVLSLVFSILNFKKAKNHPVLCFIPAGIDVTLIALLAVGFLYFLLR